MACLVQAIGFPNTSCVAHWFHGFRIVGDIPDTGLFRPHVVDFEQDPHAVLNPVSNRRWNSRVEGFLRERGGSNDPQVIQLLEYSLGL